jgi:hypothetical protein
MAMGQIADTIIYIIKALNSVTPQAILFLSALCQLATTGFAIICVFFLRQKNGK